MGLIQAAVGAAGGVLADSWRDFFYCDSLDENTLAVKGQKRTSDNGRSSNTRGESNIISDGSIVAVNDGQCMLIVESGEIVDVCAEPGQFVYDRSTEPSLFYGDLGEGIKASFERIVQRLAFGGDTGKDQRVYYINTKEIYGNKYGTSSPIPFRIVDLNTGLDLDTAVRMNGEYSYKIVDPLLFYKNVCGNIEEPYKRDRIDSQMKSELLTSLQPALSRISEMGIRYSAIPAHTKELSAFLNEEMSAEWSLKRGIAIYSFGVNSITISEEDQERLKNLQMATPLRDPNMAGAYNAAATGDAMRIAAGNEAGAVGAFMGMVMAGSMGGANAAQMFQQGGGGYQQPPQGNAYPTAEAGGFGAQPFPQQQEQPLPEVQVDQTHPSEGTSGVQPFQLGGNQQQQPQPPVVQAAPVAVGTDWFCTQCGAANQGNFCGQCGAPKPAPAMWTCPRCGSTNQGNFCGQCGTPRP